MKTTTTQHETKQKDLLSKEITPSCFEKATCAIKCFAKEKIYNAKTELMHCASCVLDSNRKFEIKTIGWKSLISTRTKGDGFLTPKSFES